MHLLLIEPHEGSRRGLAALLRLEGHEVISAASPALGLEEALRDRHDAIVTEVFTHESSAAELLDRLRQAEPQARIIATSGVFGCEEYFESAPNPAAEARARADHCVAKPVDLDRLLELISPPTAS